MKKTKNFLKGVMIFCVSSFLLVGCGNTMYDKSIEQGKLAVANQEYDKAQASFELALEEKDDDEARDMLSEVENFLAGLEAQEKGYLDESLEYFNEIVEGNHAFSTLGKEAEARISELEETKDQRRIYDEQLTESKRLVEEADYEASKELLQKVLEETRDEEYFIEVHNEAKDRLKQVDLTIDETEKQKEKEEERRKEEEAKRKEEEAQKQKTAEENASTKKRMTRSEVDEILQSMNKGLTTHEEDKYINDELCYQVNIVWLDGARTRFYWIGSESLHVYDYDNNNHGSIYDFNDFESL